MINKTFIGLLVGLLLAIAATTGGIGGFFLAAVFAIIGGLVGAQLDGNFDIRTFVDSLGNRGRG
ncbi:MULTISPECIES: hypothetical protein [Corynebacterium]|uniref:Small integral membrane protein n=2 Tax=Corynebacterium glucuronolyticum TaxID=39791 RepID=A0A7T4EFI5_9CORY|nr:MULTISPECIES: hypothetical protein [Corynebacterium]EEI28097.1 hypothetical protein HMPREF0294_0277 [Corynebacterium glucuronolyticum ATCC 51867]EEI63493.1 hypothetical protein HMPREF0293_1025 [Corynebacterium glucuronolyticum ATCC 51866]MCT1441335.1 hypothetical protein [Corynebacterium glucuronolyticum]MCT1562742.1 hypothetical protein [Corynebacterium glucuronolyticum]OFO49505.1 hypothetical protein HMPREF3044_06955 [Corynebacterium sp. HMSC073D01]